MSALQILHAFTCYELFSKGGGVQRYIHQLSMGAQAQGHRVRVAARVAESPPNGAYVAVTAGYRQLWREVAAADVVHLHGPRVIYAAVAGLFALLQRKQRVYTAHCFYAGHTRRQRLLKWLWDHAVERALFASSDAVVLLSEHWRAYARAQHLPVSRVMILPNGIDVAALEQEDFTPCTLAGAPAILSVCRLDPVKRVGDIVAALGQDGLALAHLHIVGRGEDEAHLRALAAEKKVADRVTFHHFQTDVAVAAMARAADVFVIASAEEGMPTTILEMLARGVPVVASEIAGNLSLMRPLAQPHTYPLGDVAALARAVAAAHRSDVRPEIGDALRAQFDWQAITAAMLKCYAGTVPQKTYAQGRQLLLGCPVDALAREEILARAATAIRTRGRCSIEGLNVAKIIQARRDPALMQALHNADIVHVDGAGAALATKLLGLRMPPRRAGIDLMDDLIAQCAELGASVYLLGAKDAIVTRTAAALQARYPTLKIAGTRNGYFAESEYASVAQAIHTSGATLLLIGISSPKKELFLHAHMQRCGVQVAMGVGGAFDVVAGVVARAPRWMQRAGLEWFFRMLQEPRRLARRYVETNAVFGLLLGMALLRRMLAQQSAKAPLGWDDFLAQLAAGAKEVGLACRHEIYFLHRSKPFGGRVHAVAAALRDAAWLLRVPAALPTLPGQHIAITTLAGASGMGTLTPAIAALAPAHPVTVMAHPRLHLAGAIAPARVSWRAVFTALGAMRHARRRVPNISRIVVAACLFRHALWHASWRAFRVQAPHVTHALLHNDFDMMSSSAVAALAPDISMVCVQHGIPTAEFFPTHAATQVVWGETSRAAYATATPTATLVVDALGRGHRHAVPKDAPAVLYLVSQTHTPIYGIDLAPWFKELAQELSAALPAEEFRVLLHPQEVGRTTAYAALPSSQLALPPHPALTHASTPALVAGYSSTALIDAALAGHLVVAMEWHAPESPHARAVSAPPMRCQDAASVLAFYAQLRNNPALLASCRAQQEVWLNATFTDSGDFAAHAT